MSGTSLLERLSEALRELTTAASNVRYYGLDHPYVAEYVRAAQAAIDALLESAISVTLLVVAGKLVIDGRPYPHPPAHALRFAELLRDRGMGSLTFQRGVTPEEVTALVAHLAGKGDEGMAPSQGLRNRCIPFHACLLSESFRRGIHRSRGHHRGHLRRRR